VPFPKVLGRVAALPIDAAYC